MSQISKVNILGKEYPVNFSPYVLEQISQRWGGLADRQAALTGEGDIAEPVKGSIYLMHSLMTAGHALAIFMGEANVPDVPEFDLLCMVIPTSDMRTIQTQAFAAIMAASKTTVETQAGKNTQATPAS